MRLIIDISEYNAEYIKNAYGIPQDINTVIAEAIINGKQIPTPHGRLGDLDALVKTLEQNRLCYVSDIDDESFELGTNRAIDAVRNADTIIEAEE